MARQHTFFWAAAVAALACVIVTAACAPSRTGEPGLVATIVGGETGCSAESWAQLAGDYANISGAVWIGSVAIGDEIASNPRSVSVQGQMATKVDTTVESVLVGKPAGTTVSGWVVGAVTTGTATPPDGSAWGIDGHAVILSFPGDDDDISPRLDILPIVGHDVITGIDPCLGPRGLPARPPRSVAVNTVSETNVEIIGHRVDLDDFVRALRAAE